MSVIDKGEMNVHRTGGGRLSPPGRRRNEELRPREYLTIQEVERLLAAVGSHGRKRLRNRLLILMLFSHGLRVSEACELRWGQIDLENQEIYVRRKKNGKPAVHPLRREEIDLLYDFCRIPPASQWVFCSEREAGKPMTTANVRKIVFAAGKRAGFHYPLHPHQLRHACGYYLASRGFDTRLIQDYLGHRQIRHTVLYTELAPGRFKGIWEEP